MKEIIVNLKSVRVKVTEAQYKKIGEWEDEAMQKLGLQVMNTVTKGGGLGYIIESVEED